MPSATGSGKRAQGLELLAGGMSPAEVGRRLGVARETVSRWRAAVAREVGAQAGGAAEGAPASLRARALEVAAAELQGERKLSAARLLLTTDGIEAPAPGAPEMSLDEAVDELLAGPRALALLVAGKPGLAGRARAELVAALERLDGRPVGVGRDGA